MIENDKKTELEEKLYKLQIISQNKYNTLHVVQKMSEQSTLV